MSAAERVYERIPVDRPADANWGGQVRARAAAAPSMQQMRDAGVAPEAIAAAFGVSVRTVYRYTDPAIEYSAVVVGAWTARFAVRGDRQPWRVTAWRRGGVP